MSYRKKAIIEFFQQKLQNIVVNVSVFHINTSAGLFMPSDADKAAVSKELMEKVSNPDLEHTETTTTKAPMILKLRCQEKSCKVVNDFPVHCDTQMDYIEPNQLVCGTCNAKMTVANHHNKPMKPFIAKA